jgi:hypothetical protein
MANYKYPANLRAQAVKLWRMAGKSQRAVATELDIDRLGAPLPGRPVVDVVVAWAPIGPISWSARLPAGGAVGEGQCSSVLVRRSAGQHGWSGR